MDITLLKAGFILVGAFGILFMNNDFRMNISKISTKYFSNVLLAAGLNRKKQ